MTEVNSTWDAELYDRLNKPHRAWARAIIDDLDLSGDEVVLDAGCGSGSVTFMVAEKLPRGKVYGLDYSSEMIEKITRSIAELRVQNVTPIQGDLTDFGLPEPVDLVFSNAVFHWIYDDDGLFRSLLRVTKPGGRLRAQCGGGNIFAKLMTAVNAVCDRDPFNASLAGIDDAKNYRTPEQAVASMERNGWADARADTFDAPVEFSDEEEAAVYLRTIILRDHVRHLEEGDRESYVREVISEYTRRFGPPFTADYVRLNLWARHP
jgi:trans-aconitate 2-methyltransferase